MARVRLENRMRKLVTTNLSCLSLLLGSSELLFMFCVSRPERTKDELLNIVYSPFEATSSFSNPVTSGEHKGGL
ncbi:hypothetical protein F4803DRAFT_543541, partial [Xylaria telfairii]